MPGWALFAVSLCLHIPASPGCITRRLLHPPAPLPGAHEPGPGAGAWAQSFLARVAAEGASCARPALGALLPLEGHQLGSRRVRPPPAPASQRLRRPASLRLQGRICRGTEPPKGGKRGCLSEPRGSFVFLPKEVSSYRDCSVYSPSYFTLKKKKTPPSHIGSVLYF